MANDRNALLRANLKQLKLPTMAAEFEKLAREAAAANEGCEQYLLRLSELEVAARSATVTVICWVLAPRSTVNWTRSPGLVPRSAAISSSAVAVS